MSRKVKCIFNDGTPCDKDARTSEPYCETHRYASEGGLGSIGGGPADPPIIITGGSVTVEFDRTQLMPVGPGRLSNANKKIRSVEIYLDGGPPTTIDVPNGKVTVRIFYGNP